MTSIEQSEPQTPLDSMVQFAIDRQWSIERSGDDVALIYGHGLYGKYEIALTWFEDVKALHMACGFYLQVPANRRKEFDNLIKVLNESLPVGQFTHWSESGMVLYRHSVLCPKEEPLSQEQRFALLTTAFTMCDHYGTAFVLVAQGQKASAALKLNIGETRGKA